MEEFNGSNVTTPGASEPQGSVVVSGVTLTGGSNVAGSLRSSSCDRESLGVASQAPSSNITRAEDSAGALEKGVSVRAHTSGLSTTPIETRLRNQGQAPKRVVNIANLNEDQLFDMIQGYVSTMVKFASNNRNVHKEIKETLANTGKVLSQYAKIKNAKVKATLVNGAAKTSSTQTEHTSLNEETGHPIELRYLIEKSMVEIQTVQQEQYQQIQFQLADMRRQQETFQRHGNNTPAEYQHSQRQRQEHQPKGRKPERQLQEREMPQEDSNKQQQAEEQATELQERSQDIPTWSEATRRKKRTKNMRSFETTERVRTPAVDSSKLLRRSALRTPRSQAVVLGVPPEGTSYAEAIKKAKEAVPNLAELGIEVQGVRRTAAGEILLEVKGQEKADQLADLLKKKMGDGAIVRRPIKTVPILVSGIEESIGAEELKAQLVALYPEAKIVNPIEVRTNDEGWRTARLEVSVAVAKQLDKVGRIAIGWSRAKVKIMKMGVLTCYRCLDKGHTAVGCKGEDQSRCSRKCLKEGHMAKDCVNPTAKPDEGKQCFKCLGRGHLAASCKWEDRSNNCRKFLDKGHKAKE